MGKGLAVGLGVTALIGMLAAPAPVVGVRAQTSEYRTIDGTIFNAGSPEEPNFSTSLFVAGDIRVNEQPTLAAMHTLFVREHNYQADRIAAENRG
jgi:hypothetical protein